ncbi:hypothetical protein FQR65_LT11607 [Abscondita terminalis]|nr:hypothetical protein FQR65_LT11607 [Abscondita terminalis]
MSRNESIVTQDQLSQECIDNFYLIATIQGRFAYLLMSIHAVNPSIFIRLLGVNPGPFLFKNMIYGLAVHLHSRPHMHVLGGLHRTIFSVLGSLMFNNTTMMVYEWVAKNMPQDRPYLLTSAGFVAGRILIMYFLAYLYHVDTRSVVGRNLRRDRNYETMYL